jgi:2'-5' RNA ligase
MIEWMSPAISEKGDEVFTSRDSIARVTDHDLERVQSWFIPHITVARSKVRGSQSLCTLPKTGS